MIESSLRSWELSRYTQPQSNYCFHEERQRRIDAVKNIINNSLQKQPVCQSYILCLTSIFIFCFGVRSPWRITATTQRNSILRSHGNWSSTHLLINSYNSYSLNNKGPHQLLYVMCGPCWLCRVKYEDDTRNCNQYLKDVTTPTAFKFWISGCCRAKNASSISQNCQISPC